MQLSYRAAGHETLAAINEELVFREQPREKDDDDGPEVSVAFGPAGRETLALIEGEARGARSRQSTLGYGDRISNAPGAKTPSRAPAAKTPSRAPAAKTQSRAPAAKTPSRAPAAPNAPKPLSSTPTIFEMLTFVVQDADVANLASDAQRRRFVEAHLLHRLPGQNMAQVERVDVTPWTVRDTVVVRIWCKV